MIKINNKNVEWKKELTVEEMLKKDEYRGALVVIVNGKVIAKNQYSEILISDGDYVNLIHTIAGG